MHRVLGVQAEEAEGEAVEGQEAAEGGETGPEEQTSEQQADAPPAGESDST